MTVSVDVWLRGTHVATTETFEGPSRPPAAWTEDDVRLVLEGMLRAMDRRKHPDREERPVALRGLSWIVNPFEERPGATPGGVVIAIEISLGAAVAGPFAVDQRPLETLIAKALAAPAPPPASTRVH
jgi:hypothetical protein